MSRMKPRIVITVVTTDSKWEFSAVAGRETSDGTPALPPTEKQYKIAYKAIRDLVVSK